MTMLSLFSILSLAVILMALVLTLEGSEYVLDMLILAVIFNAATAIIALFADTYIGALVWLMNSALNLRTYIRVRDRYK